MQNQKKADPKKGHYRTSPLKNGLTKLPCFLKILASWGDFFDNGLLIYPFSDHTIQCCTQKPFWVAKLEPRSCSASAFPYFEADAELGVIKSLLFKPSSPYTWPSQSRHSKYCCSSSPSFPSLAAQLCYYCLSSETDAEAHVQPVIQHVNFTCENSILEKTETLTRNFPPGLQSKSEHPLCPSSCRSM